MISIMSFSDAVHDHISIGFVRGCVACAQTEADMALSRAAYHAREEAGVSGNPVLESAAPHVLVA